LSARPSHAEVSRALLRERILDAVGELLGDRPWAEVPMAAVAERAGVSRQTLYNSFGSRQELAQAYVIREADRFLAVVAETVRANQDDPVGTLSGALGLFLAAAETHPLARAVSAGDGGDELLALVTSRGGPVLERVTGGLAGVIAENWPAAAPSDARLLADTLVRLAISHAALPGAPPQETAAEVATVLGPFVDRALERV